MKVSFNKPSAAAGASPAPSAPVVVAAAESPKVETTTTTVPTPVEGVQVEATTTVTAPPPAAAVGITVSENNSAAVAIVPKTETAVEAAKPAFYDDENMDPSDLVLPRFNVVQKVGELSNTFQPGSILLDGQLTLSAAPKANAVSTPVRIVVVGFQPTVFTEKVEGGLRGNTFKTEAEVVADGGTLDWNEHKASGKKLYQRLATAMILVEKPEGLDETAFPMELDGKRYALALYSMKGSSYTNAAKPIKTAKKIGHCKTNGFRGGLWTFASQLKKFGDNYAYIPVVRPAGPTTEAFRAQLKELLGF